MRIVEVVKLENGSHRNCDFNTNVPFILPEGWAVIPEGMETLNFPFGEVNVEKVKEIMTVIEWVPGVVPEVPEEVEEEGSGISAIEQLRADIDYVAAMTGVEL